MIIPTSELETPHYHIRRLRIDEYETEADVPSYEIDIVEDEEEDEKRPTQPSPVTAEAEKPVIGPLTHTTVAPPERPKAGDVGIIKKIMTRLFGKKAAEKKPVASESRPARPQQAQRGRHGGQRPHQRPHHAQRHERPAPPARPAPERPSGNHEQQHRPRPPQQQQAAGGHGAEGGQPQAGPDGTGRRRRRGRRRGRGPEGRPPQDCQDTSTRNSTREMNAPSDRPAREPYPPREETQAPPVTAPVSTTEHNTGPSPSATSWESPAEKNEGWNTPSPDATPHEEHHATSAGESQPKPELVQIETQSDNGNDSDPHNR